MEVGHSFLTYLKVGILAPLATGSSSGGVYSAMRVVHPPRPPLLMTQPLAGRSRLVDSVATMRVGALGRPTRTHSLEGRPCTPPSSNDPRSRTRRPAHSPSKDRLASTWRANALTPRTRPLNPTPARRPPRHSPLSRPPLLRLSVLFNGELGCRMLRGSARWLWIGWTIRRGGPPVGDRLQCTPTGGVGGW